MKNLPCATITGGTRYAIQERPELLTDSEFCKVGAYPLDYNFMGQKVQYLVGMSVPPLMTAQIATRIKEYWLNQM